MAERMTPGFAVFNGHVNNAADRALAILDEFAPKWAKKIRKHEEEGIMSIFGEKPNKATAAFTMLVTAFVNENRRDTGKRFVDFFDTYVLTDQGFIATKDDLVVSCYRYGSLDNSYQAAIYRNRQAHKRAIACASGGTVRWCREAVIGCIERIQEQEEHDNG